jgi:O-antigen ligase
MMGPAFSAKHSDSGKRTAAGRRLRPLRPLLALLALAGLAALLAGYSPSLAPPGLHPRGVELGAAQAQVLVDGRESMLTGDQPITEYRSYLAAQLALNYALYLQSDGATAALGRDLGLGDRSVAASGPFTLLLNRTNYAREAPTLPEPRSVDHRYRLLLDVDGARPLLSLYAQAPTVRAALALVRDARALLQRHVTQLQAAHPLPSALTVVLRPLGPAIGGRVDPGVRWQLMIFAFLLVLVVGGSLLWAWRRRRTRLTVERLNAASLDRLAEPPVGREDDWPHTRRVLPWGLAFFMAMLFLVPIDAISLPVHLPINGTLDRPVVVALAMLWLASLALLSGAARPRMKLGRVHFMAILFLAVCLGSVALNGQALSNMHELSLAIKKLGLLLSYIVFFFIAASALRPREVPRFAALMVGLGVVVALGTIVEFRMHYNVFYELWGKLFPITYPEQFDQVDEIGRLTVYGPTLQPLELAGMLALVLPFAILGALDAPKRSRRVLYAIAVGLLLAGGVATSRKTSLVVPAAVLLILIAYRPRPMLGFTLRIGVPLLLIVHLASPSALGSVVGELEPGHLNSALTTTDRTARYDAVAPDILRHPLIGRGYESYEPQKYRILDNEYLDLLITVGLIGTLCYLALIATMLSAAHRTIRGPDPRRASLALAAFTTIAAIAIASALFDVLSFPHVPYLLFFVAAMILALREPSPAGEPAGAALAQPLGHVGPGPAPSATNSADENPPAPVREREPVLA